MHDSKRESLSSGLGFLLVSAGCAVGLGNVWRFPYMVGQNGGALFVLFYILFLLVFGLPFMVAEFAVGRASRQSVVKAYAALRPDRPGFRAVGIAQACANWLLMMYYTTVAGWLLAYPAAMLSGRFDFSNPSGYFDAFIASPTRQTLFMAIACVIGFAICALGLRKGVEKVTKGMMALLFVILLGLCVYVLTLDGSAEGLRFYLRPSLDLPAGKGWADILEAALGQSFFTLSLGIGAMAIFGSYTSKERTLGGESLKIILIDTLVALLAGLVIFPACFAFNVRPDAGPSLIFTTLPSVFAQMQIGEVNLGPIVGTAFFIFLALAALTTIITVFENIVAMAMDSFGKSRTWAICLAAPGLLLLSLPCALGFNLLSRVHPLGGKSTILDFEDFLVSNIALPLGALAILIFCVSRRYWGWDNFLAEANAGEGLRLPRCFRFYMTWVLPALLLALFVLSLRAFFAN